MSTLRPLPPGEYTVQLGYWIVQDKDTGHILGTGKHSSHIEFEDELPPRLFLTKAAASAALRAWKAGVWRTSQEWEATDEYGSGFYYRGLPRPIPKSDRAERNLAVVPVGLCFAHRIYV